MTVMTLSVMNSLLYRDITIIIITIIIIIVTMHPRKDYYITDKGAFRKSEEIKTTEKQ